jgi:prepilin-type N-terminal cleavage/methylation domain-containing protein
LHLFDLHMSLPWNEDGVGAGFIRCQRGFTLVEILVATAVGLVVVAGIFAFNRFQLRSLQGQAHQLDIQGTTRGLTLLLEQEVRNAGTNPRAVATFSAIAHRSDAGEIHLQSDYNGDGRVDDDGEDVRYVLDVENQRILRFDDGDSEVLIDRIVLNGARFRYFNGAGVELTPGDQGLTSAQRNAVRKVRLELAMEQQNLGLANSHPVDPLNFGVIRSVGEAARESYRAVRVTVRKNGLAGSPGAIYVANDSVSATFNGNSFEIDGNDQTALGAPASTDVTRPGIATRNDGVAETVTNALREGNNGCGQRDQVRGLGYEESSCTPSVVTSPGPTPEQIDRMIDNILEGNAGVVVPWYNRHINGNDVLGTPETPQITHVGGDVQVIGNGNASGAGILIVEGDFTINGGFDFWGWIVVRGNLTVSGSANVRGAIWTSGVQITASGSAAVSYCTECLDLADRAGYGSALGGNIPRTMMVVAWQQE